MNEQKKAKSSAFGWILVGISAVALLSAVIYVAGQPLVEDLPAIAELKKAPVSVEDAREALRNGEIERAAALVQQLLDQAPESPAALLVAGEVATRTRQPQKALEYYAAIPDDGSEAAIQALWAAAEIKMLFLGRLSDAEADFRRVIDRQPTHVIANQRLAFLLGIEGRRWESRDFLLQTIRQREFAIEHLLALGNLEEPLDDPDFVSMALQAVPADPIPLIGTARADLSMALFGRARQTISQVLALRPGNVEALAVKGLILLQDGDANQFHQWHGALPSEADEHPEIWYVRGAWAQNQGELAAAARCLWEAVRRHPGHRPANYRLSQVLIAMGRKADAEPFVQQAKMLDELLQLLTSMQDRLRDPATARGSDLADMVAAARLTEELGRIWEAWGWYRLALTRYSEETSLRPHFNRVAEVLDKTNPPPVLETRDPSVAVNLSNLPLPNWSDLRVEPVSPAVVQSHDVQPRFANVATRARLDFKYFNSDDPTVAGMMIFQELGGAVAVLDYDQDGWPDVYLSQGSPWPSPPGQTDYIDRLFRNLGNGTFEDVTEPANLGDERFSGGVAVGDYNNDGFPDLYVGNLGGNRLFRNNGDGTFAEVSGEAGIAGQSWTTSCLMADVNGDGFPDLYDVNYLAGQAPFERVCRLHDRPRVCPLSYFEAEQDRFYLNLGDGRFREMTEQAGLVARDGKGLGIIAADFHGSGQLNLLVANDTTANFYFVNHTSSRGAAPNFQEHALLAGLAYDRDGRSQACMGIAVDDADGDALLDLYITNYHNESSAFYKQQSADFFVDDSAGFGLRQTSLPFLGFGTQYLDADLDGAPDLVVTNGHVDDFQHLGVPFRMRPQFLRNDGNGFFAETPSNKMGDYFQGEYLGRSLARLDFNRDGLLDFAVMHLYEPVALLENQTETPAHFANFHVRGVASGRDAIGTTLHLTAAGKTWTKQLTAGDGYQASNQRIIPFGLGNANHIDRLVVRWPSGLEESYTSVDVDREWIVVEGRGELVEAVR